MLSWPSKQTSIGVRAGHEGPVSTKGDLDAIKPILLEFGDDILAYIGKVNTTSDW